jgi:hypothetical protein
VNASTIVPTQKNFSGKGSVRDQHVGEIASRMLTPLQKNDQRQPEED